MAKNPENSTPEHPPERIMAGEYDSGEGVDIVGADSDGGAVEKPTEGAEAVDLSEVDDPWGKYFPYDSAYADQVDAINEFTDVLADNGFQLLEGACGTGKTLAALSGALQSIRDRKQLSAELDGGEGPYPSYERALVVTPVKQQLRQFVDEVRGINRELPGREPPVDTVVMRGRPDLMPYANAEVAYFDERTFREGVDDLREMARDIIAVGSDFPIDWPESMSPPEYSRSDYDWGDASPEAKAWEQQHKYDPNRARAVVNLVSSLADDVGGTDEDGRDTTTLTIDGVETPYPSFVPHTRDIVDERRVNGELPTRHQGCFDPFYVGAFTTRSKPPVSFGEAEANVFDRRALLNVASKGICPHEAMAMLASEAEVVLGNYHHAFDPQTRLLSKEKIGLIDEETILVVDEAHRVEGETRDMLSRELDLYTLERAQSDVSIAIAFAVGDASDMPVALPPGRQEMARAKVLKALSQPPFEVSVEQLNRVADFLSFVRMKLLDYSNEELIDTHGERGWRDELGPWDPSDMEGQLANPEAVRETDALVEDAKKEGYSEEVFREAYAVMLSLETAYEELSDAGIYTRTPQGVSVGAFFKSWVVESRVEYFRQVILEGSRKESVPENFPAWVEGWTPKFRLYNCIPRDELRRTFAELGGGILMSATIEPVDVYKQTVGVGDIPELDSPESSSSADSAEDEPADSAEDESADSAEDESADSAEDESAETDTDILDRPARPNSFSQFPLRFPEENRASFVCELPKFTWKKRGEATTNWADMSDVREQYAQAILQVARSSGNVLIALPNYTEAKWAYDLAGHEDVTKERYLDQSSESDETSETLQQFFEEEGAVIFTSTLGTITEGVDYDGAKLHCCAVVGVPLPPVNAPHIKAIRTAYDEQLRGGRRGFETALTVPAVRKTRQALGRVIRGGDETGVRVLIDRRYNSTAWDGVVEYLSEQEQKEFTPVALDSLDDAFSTFWEETPLHQNTQSNQEESADTNESATELAAAAEVEDVGAEELAGEYSKIYFGSGATLSGWISVERLAAQNEIIPLVHEHSVDKDDASDVNTIQLNFASELPASGWTEVEREVVLNDIEPIAKRHRE